LVGAVFCFPAGWLLDRFGLRWVSAGMVVALGAVVWAMSGQAGSVAILFLLILLTRAIGQSALSVASITVAAKSFGQRVGVAMAVYSVLLSLFFAGAFVWVGSEVRTLGWRAAWMDIAISLMVIVAPIVLLFVKEVTSNQESEKESVSGVSLNTALRTRAFWVFGGAAAMYGLVSSGLGLFNEAVLAERGFDQKTYHTLLAATTGIALVGQFGCGALTVRWPMQRLLGIAMLVYAAALCVLPFVKTMAQLWAFAAMMGISGGMVTVLFFAVWRAVFGPAQLGRIQGAAQMLTVFASAVGPVIFAKSAASFSSYSPILLAMAVIVTVFGIVAWRTGTELTS
jgi:MFS family permease